MSDRDRNTKRRSNQPSLFIILLVLIGILGFILSRNPAGSDTDNPDRPSSPVSIGNRPSPGAETPANTEGPVETEPPKPSEPLWEFDPAHTSVTSPWNFFTGTRVMVDGTARDTYELLEHIDFGLPENYTALEGIITFRGNNFRDTAAYGRVSLTAKKFQGKWNSPLGALTAPDGEVWPGSGWTGQPLIVKWPKSTREQMNMYSWAKEQAELVEVIHATMDGNIYFLELETGRKTRDDLWMGYTFKGAGSLDPRGYPILYVGAGYNSHKGVSRVFIISLIDGSVLYEFGNSDAFSLRGGLSYFDASPLVDAETDQLIYPGESGILYIIKLNSFYDEESGTLTMHPSDPVKWRYNGKRTGAQFWLGMEDSPVIWRGRIIMADNGGNLMCLNLNTLTLDWVQDVLDDTNCTPVLELEDGHPYIYISTSFHYGWRSTGTATVPVWKIDALNGEIVWQKDYNCYSYAGLSGGVQGTLAIGKHKLQDLIFVPVARTPTIGAGELVALNKKTGEQIWSLRTDVYSWSSPVAVYDIEGNGYIIYCTSGGFMYLLDGLTGEKLDSIDLGSNIEASPAVYNNTVVVGTRGTGIYGVTLG